MNVHDRFFKETFSDEATAAAELRSVLPRKVARMLDWSTLRVESGTFVSGRDKDRFCDLLFSVRRRDTGKSVLVFVLFEHQSGNDELMPLRMLRYMLRIWERWIGKQKKAGAAVLPLPPIIPVVLAHADGGWTSARTFEELFEDEPNTQAIVRGFGPRLRFVLDDLADVDDAALAERSLPPGATLSLWALRDGRAPEEVWAHMAEWAPMFAALATLPGGAEAIERIIGYLGEAAGERSVDVERFSDHLAALAPGAEETVMNSVERLRMEGRVEGRMEGRVEGRVEGERTMLLRLLTSKFGEPTESQIEALQAADLADLERYVGRIFTAQSIDDVLGAE